MKDKKIVEALTENESTVTETETIKEKKPFKIRLSEWWQKFKPSKRRLIQIYAALLYNANIKGYITGKIFTGPTKVMCVPGLNCYSCPGAVGACPLGALQNALASSNKRAPYYVIGILLLYGLIFGRVICGFLCPVGLGQDLLYKIKTPKIQKSRVTKVLSYFKYVLLAVLVIGIPLIYAIDQTAVPGFCKYICPAGTFGGAMLLLIHPENASMFSMLGALFTWKTALLFLIIALCIFIYRAFCRFLCPLGAIYGLFNRFSILGIKVNKDKCIDCGKCVTKCKMDIKTVGGHECINCGECIPVCPTKAIVWKGGKWIADPKTETCLAAANAVTEKPIALNETAVLKETAATEVNDGTAVKGGEILYPEPCKPLDKNSIKTKKGKAFWSKLTAIILAAALLIGVFVYANFIYVAPTGEIEKATYIMTVSTADGKTGFVSFKIGNSDDYVTPVSGSGTKADPYILSSPEGQYAVAVNSAGETTYFKFEFTETTEYDISAEGENLALQTYFVRNDKQYGAYSYSTGSSKIVFTLAQPETIGNTVGYQCYDFTLKVIGSDSEISLYDYRGKVTVVNFWGVWCGPCVQELPDFEKVREAEDVEVIAIHSVLSSADAPQFLIDKGWDTWGIHFVQDTGTANFSEIYNLLGGRNGAYPRTLIIDADGIITEVFEGSVSESTLAAAVKRAKGE